MSASEAAPPLLSVRRVAHCFDRGEGGRPVLVDIGFDVRAGEIVMLTGPSGSGKTTLLTLVGALRTLQSGSIRLWDTELAKLDAAGQVGVRRRIGFIFQEHNLFESLTSAENIAMATCLNPDLSGLAGADMLARLGLGGLEGRKPRELSSGQRQRVAIARALAPGPGLVLADEPTAALDRTSGASVIELLRRLADTSGTAVVLVTHDSRMFSLADRLLKIVDGRLASDIHVKTLIALCKQLHRSGEFSALSATALVRIARAMNVAMLSPGERVSGGGILLEGRAQTEGLPAVLTPGAVFGARFLIEGGAQESLVALTPGRIATIDRESFASVCAQSQQTEDEVLAQLFHSLIQ